MSRVLAKQVMAERDAALIAAFGVLSDCIAAHPTLAVAIQSKAVGSREYYQALAERLIKGRLPKRPQKPMTVPDAFVGLVLEHYFGVSAEALPKIQEEHALSMGAENIVGDLLERYISNCLEPLGWVWCAGSTLRSVDFIKPPANKSQAWVLLQVKNRDNSENSSSSAIRGGTDIQHWHRSFSRKVGDNWAAFPSVAVGCGLAEEGFKSFAVQYLQALRN